MKLIDRYILRQLFVTATFAIAVLSLVLVLGKIFKELLDLLVNHEVPIQYILTFIAYILPFSLTFTIPWGFLTAVLLVMGKMSAENELVALRSIGVSMVRVSTPLLVLAVIACSICLWINLEVAPQAQERMRSTIFQIATSNPLAMFNSDEVIDEFPDHKIYVEKKQGTKLENLLLYEYSNDDEPIRVITAGSGEIKTDLKNQQVLLKLYDAHYEGRNQEDPGDLDKIQQGITMGEVVLPISLRELYEKNRKRQSMGQETLRQLLSRDDASKTAARLEVSRRFSLSFASLAFALIGVPLAITAHRRETSIGFFFSIVIAFVYFFFIILANMAKNNPALHPEWLIWAPNVVFIGLGLFLFYRLGRR